MADIKNKITFQNNVGGIRLLYFFPLSKLTQGLFIPQNSIFNIEAFNSLNANFASNLFAIYFQSESASFKQEQALTDSGEIYKQSVEFIISKDYYERTAQFNSMVTDRFLVFIIDNNNQSRVIGEAFVDGTNNGAKFSQVSDTGAAFDSSNQTKLLFYCESTSPAPSLGSEGNAFFDLQAPDTLD
jgi:hypothetical protein